ncbi:MAG: choice-of-anchor D domain-containing protein [Verrucomicrobiota bacterium]
MTLLVASAADAKIIYVNAAKTGGNGTSWSRAFTYLQDALEVAVPGDNVYLAKGTYFPDDGVPNGFGDREISFEINRVNLYGGFAGNETSFSQRNISANPTILSGEIWAVTPTTQGYERYWSLHVLKVSGSCRLDGLTVQKGRANGEEGGPSKPEDSKGGGILVSTGQTVQLANCTLFDNFAANMGGAVYGKVNATNTKFIGNQVNNEHLFNSNPDRISHWLYFPNGSGGAVEGEISASRCSFTNNTVTVQGLDLGVRSSATGGAINGSKVTLTDCVFDGNGLSAWATWWPGVSDSSFATGRGGAVSGPTTATRCTFSNNTISTSVDSRNTPDPTKGVAHYTSFPSSFGGAIAGKTVAVNCVFTSNSISAEARDGDETRSYNAGSALYLEGASSVANCLFTDNSAESINDSSSFGGWVYTRGAVLGASGSTIPISNSTFLDNTSSGSGAALASEGSVNIISNIFTYNGTPAASASAASLLYIGQRPENAAGARARISNRLYPTPSTETINFVKGGFNAVRSGAFANVDFGTPPERTFIGQDPAIDSGFVDITDPAGPDGKWRTGDDGLRLTSSSPAIGKGINLFLAPDTADLDGDGNRSEAVPNDLAGYVRIQGGTLDLGAYEFGPRINAPDISVEQPAGVPLVDNVNTVDLSSPSAQPQIFVIRNTGLQVLNQLAVVATGVNSSDFVVTQPKTNILSINATTTFTVSFRPRALGNRVAKISVVSNDPDENPFDIALTGNAQLPDIAVEYPAGTGLTSGTSTIDFGAISSTASASRTFTIRNTGLGNLALDSIRSSGGNASSFIPSAPAATFLAPGASTTFTVRFDPSLGGNLATTIVVGNSDPDAEAAFQIKVKGLGVKAPEIVVSQPFSAELKDGDSVGFGSVRIASNYTKTFVIKNTGTLQLTDIKVSVSGSKTFSRGQFKKKKLAVGASAEFTVTFNPTSTGSKSANLRIVSNDSDERQIDITLKGKGVKKGSNNAPKKGSNSFAAAFAASATSVDQGVVTTVTGDDGLKYQTLTVEKVAGEATGTVQVSANLLDWYSGSRHTTTLVDSASILKVRDNTPVRSGEKRYIRVK